MYDIVSQYASAASEPLPVGRGFFFVFFVFLQCTYEFIFLVLVGPAVGYQAFIKNSTPRLSRDNLVDLGSFCRGLQKSPSSEVVFKKMHSQEQVFLAEHYRVRG